MRADGITSAIGRQKWMTPVEEKVQQLVHRAYSAGGPAGRKIKNFLHGTWMGHPLHVILTDVPIGAWTAAVTFDALGAISEREEFEFAADAAVAVGLTGAVGAAVTGLTDWQDIDPPARGIGLVHGLLNLGSAALFGGSLVARRRGERATGRNLAALGYAVSFVAATLGGNLVYSQKIGVDHTSADRLPFEFTPICAEAELKEDQPVRAEHRGTPILLVRRGEQIFALYESCSHLGGPLSEGALDGDMIQCPWHGSRFAIRDGHVVDGPATHPQPCLETRVRAGRVEVRRSDCRPVTGSIREPDEQVPPTRTGTAG